MRFSSFLCFTLLCVTLNFDLNNGYRILGIFPSNVKSHFVMFEKLMNGLIKKGHSVDVISYFPLDNQRTENYKHISIRDILPAKQNNVSFQSFIKPMRNIFWITLVADDIGHKFCDIFKKQSVNDLISKSSPEPYDLIVTELFFAPCYFALGRHLNAPIVAMSSNALFDFMNDPFGNPVNPSFVPSGMVNYSQKMTFWQRVINTICTNFMKILFNHSIKIQDKYVEKYFGPGYPTVYELQKEVALILVNSHFLFNGIRPITPSIIEVGGMHIEEKEEEEKLPQEIEKWLDESDAGCIYVSFGSMVKIESFPKEILNHFYTTFRNIKPVRVLMKIANDKELPPGMPENVKIQPWLPQIQILKHKNTKAFMTHGGLMGTMEAIYYGVPMIGVPLFGDQHSNMHHYEREKIAILMKLETINADRFTNAIQNVLNTPLYRTRITELSRIFKDRQNTPLETAIFWVEFICRNGNILKSPAIDLEWWQVQLLDVYGFLFLVIFITFYLIYSLSRILIRFLRRLKSHKKFISGIAKKNM